MSYEISDLTRDIGDIIDQISAWQNGGSARDAGEAIGNELEDIGIGLIEDIDREDGRDGGTGGLL